MKTNILLVFGGKSTEHEISVKSCANVDKALDRSRYNVYKVFISKEGLWRYYEGDIHQIDEEALVLNGCEAAILPGSEKAKLLVRSEGHQHHWTEYDIDVAIPVLHGKNGEDGTIQGLFEIARLPYVGCGVLASAVSMDKITTKRVVAQATDVAQAAYTVVYDWEIKDFEMVAERVEKALAYPVYVKPANAGSSVGVSRAEDREGLREALETAAAVDSRILIEETIYGREIECAVLGPVSDPKASGVGEILAADTFYTYEAKYNNPDSKTVLDPVLPEGKAEEVRQAAVKIFQAVSASGLSRVDFFVENKTGRVVFNEINTFPGFTNISMYPMLWKNKGIDAPALMDELIRLAKTEK